MDKEISEKRICEYCNKTLTKIGMQRVNCPSSYNDWTGRKYHKKCYAIMMCERNRAFDMKLLEKRIEKLNLK